MSSRTSAASAIALPRSEVLSIRTQLLRWTPGALSLEAVILGLATYAFALD